MSDKEKEEELEKKNISRVEDKRKLIDEDRIDENRIRTIKNIKLKC